VQTLALALAFLTGEPFQYSSQNNGEVAAILEPSESAPPNSNGYPGDFGLHSDDPNVPDPFRVRTIVLAGFKNDSRVATGYAPLEKILLHLSPRSTWELLQPNFTFRPPPSFGAGQHRTASRPVLYPGDDGRLRIQFDHADTRGQSREARRALVELACVANDAMRWFVVGPGSSLIFRNDRGLHARQAINGARQIVRVYTTPSLDALRQACSEQGRVFDVRRLI